MDVLNEIDRRLSGSNTSSQAGAPRDGSQKLALLGPADFMGLAQTVFEEQSQRENSVIYVARFRPSSDSKPSTFTFPTFAFLFLIYLFFLRSGSQLGGYSEEATGGGVEPRDLQGTHTI